MQKLIVQLPQMFGARQNNCDKPRAERATACSAAEEADESELLFCLFRPEQKPRSGRYAEASN